MSERVLSPNRLHFCLVAVGLLAMTIYGSIVPLQYRPTTIENAVATVGHAMANGPGNGRERSSWGGLADSIAHSFGPGSGQVRADYILNSLQYGILGFFILGAVAIDRSRIFAVICAISVIPSGCILAYWLEVLQVFFPPRTISGNDIFIERLGFIVGCCVWIMAGPEVVRWSRAFWNGVGFIGLATRLLPSYVLVLLVLRLMPFDFAMSLDALAHKQAAGQIQWLPSRDVLPTTLLGFLVSFCEFIPIGAMLSMLPRWSSRPILATILTGFGLAALIEIGQLFVFPLTFRSLDILASTLGTMLAATLIRDLNDISKAEPATSHRDRSRHAIESRLRRLCETIGAWGSIPWVVLIVIWAVLVIAISWQPFHFEFTPRSTSNMNDVGVASAKPSSPLERWSWAPFASYYWLSRYNAFDMVVKRLVFFAPLGVLAAVLFSQRSRVGILICLFIALIIGLIIELGQCYIPERHPGVTDLAIHLVGTWLGFAFTSHTIRSVNRSAA